MLIASRVHYLVHCYSKRTVIYFQLHFGIMHHFIIFYITISCWDFIRFFQFTDFLFKALLSFLNCDLVTMRFCLFLILHDLKYGLDFYSLFFFLRRLQLLKLCVPINQVTN